MMTGNS